MSGLAMLWGGLFFGVFALAALAHAARAHSPRRALVELIRWLNPLNGDRLLFNFLSLGPAVLLMVVASRVQGGAPPRLRTGLWLGWFWIGLLLVLATGALVFTIQHSR